MTSIQQLSVFTEKKPGVLAKIATILGQNGVDIQALCIADTTEFGVLRLIVDHMVPARTALEAAGFHTSLTDVLAVGVEHHPGGLGKVLEALEQGAIVEYCYAFLSRKSQQAHVILRMDDNAKAAGLLENAGFRLVSAQELF
ncbi:MAG: hypothetical protein RR135_02260 [Oscillospiraceae bacterium]